MHRAILDLCITGYEVKFVHNPANNKYIGVRLSKDGYHVQGNVKIDKWNDDHVMGALAQVKSVLDQRLART